MDPPPFLYHLDMTNWHSVLWSLNELKLDRYPAVVHWFVVCKHDEHIHVAHICTYANPACRCRWITGCPKSSIYRRPVRAINLGPTDWSRSLQYLSSGSWVVKHRGGFIGTGGLCKIYKRLSVCIILHENLIALGFYTVLWGGHSRYRHYRHFSTDFFNAITNILYPQCNDCSERNNIVRNEQRKWLLQSWFRERWPLDDRCDTADSTLAEIFDDNTIRNPWAGGVRFNDGCIVGEELSNLIYIVAFHNLLQNRILFNWFG